MELAAAAVLWAVGQIQVCFYGFILGARLKEQRLLEAGSSEERAQVNKLGKQLKEQTKRHLKICLLIIH